MARVLDLNSVQRSILDLTLQDEARTVVHLDYPSEAMVDELQSLQPELQKVKTGDRNAVEMIYDLIARFINCNLDFFTVTGDELISKYNMNLVSAMAFLSAYMTAIDEVQNQKN